MDFGHHQKKHISSLRHPPPFAGGVTNKIISDPITKITSSHQVPGPTFPFKSTTHKKIPRKKEPSSRRRWRLVTEGKIFVGCLKADRSYFFTPRFFTCLKDIFVYLSHVPSEFLSQERIFKIVPCLASDRRTSGEGKQGIGQQHTGCNS